jgi:hypothetical protein
LGAVPSRKGILAAALGPSKRPARCGADVVLRVTAVSGTGSGLAARLASAIRRVAVGFPPPVTRRHRAGTCDPIHGLLASVPPEASPPRTRRTLGGNSKTEGGRPSVQGRVSRLSRAARNHRRSRSASSPRQLKFRGEVDGGFESSCRRRLKTRPRDSPSTAVSATSAAGALANSTSAMPARRTRRVSSETLWPSTPEEGHRPPERAGGCREPRTRWATGSAGTGWR